MIALPHHLPFVKAGENSTLIQTEWLEEMIINAVQGTIFPEWFAIDVARGIQKYFENSFEGSVIDSEVLLSDIRKTLTYAGANEIAENLEWIAPPLRISLTDLARKAGHSFNGSFHQLLEDKCQEAVNSYATRVEYHGLGSCAESLSKSNSNGLSEQQIKQEIESKIDEYRYIGELSKPIFNVSVAH